MTDRAQAEPVGFIGLGQIGAPMAARLTGWPGGLIVHDARPEAMAPLADAGAKTAASVAEVAAAAGIVSVMVRDDDQVRDVVRAAAPGRRWPTGDHRRARHDRRRTPPPSWPRRWPARASR